MIITAAHLTITDAEKQFAAWLATQKNANGNKFKSFVANRYAQTLRTEPPKLDISLTLIERDVFRCRTTKEFDALNNTFRAAPNFQKINRGANHGAFSAGLAVYRRYVQYLESNENLEIHKQQAVTKRENKIAGILSVAPQLVDFTHSPQRVDFTRPQLCKGTNPLTCKIGSIDVPIRKTWIDLLVDLVELFLKIRQTEISNFKFRSGRSLFLDEEIPKISCKTLSNGKIISVNYSIDKIITLIGRICEACGVDLADVVITYTPKQSWVDFTHPPQRVDFTRPQLCKGTNPLTCKIGFIDVPIRKTWIDLLVDLVELFLKIKQTEISNFKFRSGRSLFLDEEIPEINCKTLSNGKIISVDYTIDKIVTLIGRICETCGLDLADVVITYIPKQNAEGLVSAMQPDNDSTQSELMNTSVVAEETTHIPEALIAVLNKNYCTGFRFENTYIKLLAQASGIEVDEHIQSTLKRLMFRRNDGVYFLLDIVANVETRETIIELAENYLQEHGCFEIPELYRLYADKMNSNCVRSADDFESLYQQIVKSDVRCVKAPYIDNKMARYNNGNVWNTFKEIALKIVAVITDEYYGSCNEDDLHTRFQAFSTDLIGKIIKHCAADELIRVEINGSICYQTFDALGLPDEFSKILTESLERLSDIGLDPTQDILHTTLSLELGVNFKEEYNLPDWETYRRLITIFYKTEPPREWKYNIFGEATK